MFPISPMAESAISPSPCPTRGSRSAATSCTGITRRRKPGSSPRTWKNEAHTGVLASPRRLGSSSASCCVIETSVILKRFSTSSDKTSPARFKAPRTTWAESPVSGDTQDPSLFHLAVHKGAHRLQAVALGPEDALGAPDHEVAPLDQRLRELAEDLLFRLVDEVNDDVAAEDEVLTHRVRIL